MADGPDIPQWRQRFDSIERELTPRLDSLLRSEQFAVAVGLAARVQRAVEGEMARNTRRVLHRLNLPAGTDVSRILNEIGQLRIQVRDLTVELEETKAELAEAERAPAPAPRAVRSAPSATSGSSGSSAARATPAKKRARKAS